MNDYLLIVGCNLHNVKENRMGGFTNKSMQRILRTRCNFSIIARY